MQTQDLTLGPACVSSSLQHANSYVIVHALENMERPGWWPAGSGLDRIDKWWSSFVFELELGLLELPLSVPGHWFGAPPMALATLPIVSGAIAAQSRAMAALSTVIVGNSLYFWFSTLNMLRNGGNMGSIYMPGGPERYSMQVVGDVLRTMNKRASQGHGEG